ncbi:MAG: hypothetical protein HKN79_01340 [Flavobacteriales bacterium]|nr:hypothetical protein [Flavobacteriales bacterium]
MLLASCVSYLPPSSLHHDMVINRHAVIEDSLTTRSRIAYAEVHGLTSGYHHRRDPEMEDNRAASLRSGISQADSLQSFGFSVGLTNGHMYDDDGNRYRHRNLIFRGSYAYDFHDGPWNGHIVKVQLAGSRGFGRYQSLLAENFEERDRYNLAMADDRWLFSFGLGSQFFYDFSSPHDVGLGLFFIHSTDLQKEGFHAEYFNMTLDYVFQDRYSFTLGGMMDARFTPRGETLYLGLGYIYSFQ